MTTKILVQHAIPLISAILVYHYLNGIDFFTRVLDSLVISFIVLWLQTQLIESGQNLISSFGLSTQFKTTAALAKENIHFDEYTTPATPPTTLGHPESIPPPSETSNTTTTVTTTTTTTTAPSPTLNSSSTNTIEETSSGHAIVSPLETSHLPATPILSSLVAPNQPDARSASEAQVLFSEPEQIVARSLLKERAYQVRNGGNGHLAGRRPRVPVISLSTPLRRRSHYDTTVPLPLMTPLSPPALSPSLSTSSTGSWTAFESDLLRLRRASRVEEMIHKFDHGTSMGHKHPGSQRHRRYSVGCVDDYPKIKPIIRNRTYGFKPIVGIWEQRIKETTETTDKPTPLGPEQQ